MFKKIFVPVCLMACAGAVAAPTCEVVDGKYVFTVPENETYTLTAEDVATMMSEDYVNYPLAKAGAGTLVVGAVMADYTNAIYILDGQYKATDRAAFGTTNGITYVDGGTVWSTRSAPTGDNNPATGSEAFHLKGTGYNNLGVIRQTDNDCYNFAAKGGITLDGDIRVTGTKALEFRYGSVNCNSHTVTVAMNANVMFRFVATSISNPGSVEVESGRFGFESQTGTGSAAQSVTVEPGARLYLQNVQNEQLRTLWLKEGASVEIGQNGTHKPGEITNMNRWSGAVTVDGDTTVQFDKEGRVFNLSALVSGVGGFFGFGGGYIQFSNTNNTFAGGVSVTGKVGAVAGVVTGGVSLVKTTTAGLTYTVPFAVVPSNGAPIRISNAQLGVFNVRVVDLPDVYADGRTSVTGTPLLVKGTFKSLTKTGSDALTIYGPFRVLGATDVQGGTLRFGTRVPDVPTGLNWYYRWGTTGSRSSTIPANVPFYAVEPEGASFAYKYWPTTTGVDGSPNHYQTHYYTGYVRIPGEEGDQVTCNFVSAIARYTYLAIGGTVVVNVDDNKDALHNNAVIGYSRLYVGPPVTLTAGWKTFFLYMGNSWNATAGPKINNSALGWPYDFGVGVDWQARCVTNSANYVKFLDPGDGSFLRPTLAGKADVDPAGYPRPSFGGAVAFGPGTVFDVGDVAPYTPVIVPSLTGAPTVMNGEVHVTNTTWTLRAADVAAGQPLTVAAGAKVKFAAGTTIAVQDEDDIPHQAVKEYPILCVEAGGTIENTPAYERPRGSKWFAEWTEDNTQLNLVYHDGFHILVR